MSINKTGGSLVLNFSVAKIIKCLKI